MKIREVKKLLLDINLNNSENKELKYNVTIRFENGIVSEGKTMAYDLKDAILRNYFTLLKQNMIEIVDEIICESI